MKESELLRDRLRFHLAKQRDLMSGQMKNASQFHYKGIADFLLREGEFFEPRPLPAGIDYLEPRYCYQNAFINRTALQERFVYVEGYAISSSRALPLLHAWNLAHEGFVVDRTWNPQGRVYFGVIFRLTRIPRNRGTQYAVIDDWEHSYPMLREAWDGETSRKQAFGELNLLKA